MLGLKKTILGISDLKKIFQSIKSSYSVDFLDYALSSLKRRVEEFMFRYYIQNIDDLILKLEKDQNYFQSFMQSILVDSTEMFRDPEFWDDFKNQVLKKYRYASEIKIWIPDCNSGEELYTILIVLSQLKLIDKSHVILTTLIDFNVERINKAIIDQKSMELNISNFERFEEGAKLDEYFITKTNASVINSELFANVKVLKHNLFTEKTPGVFDIILFRNKMLYFNPQLKTVALNKLTAALKPGGYLAIGIKEMLDYPLWEQDYIVMSDSEKIYKKILA